MSFAGTLWVVVRTWLPGTGIGRALVATVVAIGLGSFGLIRGENSDFLVLGHDPLVVGLLVGLVGLVGLSVSLVDEWLDRRLPVAASVTSRPTLAYTAISLVGALLILPLTLAAFLGDDMRPAGLGLVVVGLATLRWWVLRYRGVPRPPAGLIALGRLSLFATVALGFAAELPEIAGALGID